jgi:predicted regulator of Ras-like GTPase activity (Roadblock/LC7/MglB family)
MAWLLRQFASETPGVTHAVLLSRDGLRLLDSDVDKDWADQLSAALSGVASLATNITGPSHEKRPVRQVIIERNDCLVFVRSVGGSAAFNKHPGSERGERDTILAVMPREPDLERGSGQGLLLVRAFSDEWGWRRKALGKTVWCKRTQKPPSIRTVS